MNFEEFDFIEIEEASANHSKGSSFVRTGRQSEEIAKNRVIARKSDSSLLGGNSKSVIGNLFDMKTELR